MSGRPLLQAAAASYEGSLFGWELHEVETTDEDEVAMEAKMSWGFHASPGSLRAVAVSASGRYLVCGGENEVIRIFDMTNNKSLGDLAGTHTGSITALEFFEDSFLLSGSQDNSVCIWRVQDWACVHILGGHKKPINDISIHPSGKMAISVGQDRSMRLWNLVKGNLGFTRGLKEVAEQVQWAPDGEHYMLVMRTLVLVHSAATNEVVAEIDHGARINRSALLPGVRDGVQFVVLSVCDNKHLLVYHHKQGHEGRTEPVPLKLPEEHGRPKDLQTATGADGKLYTVVISSSGVMLAFDDALFEEGATVEDSLCALFAVDAEPRLTCLAAWSPDHARKMMLIKNKKKRKLAAEQKEHEQEEEEEQDEPEALIPREKATKKKENKKQKAQKKDPPKPKTKGKGQEKAGKSTAQSKVKVVNSKRSSKKK